MAQLQKYYKLSNTHQIKTTLSTITQKQNYRKPNFDIPSWRKNKTKDSLKVDVKLNIGVLNTGMMEIMMVYMLYINQKIVMKSWTKK